MTNRKKLLSLAAVIFIGLCYFSVMKFSARAEADSNPTDSETARALNVATVIATHVEVYQRERKYTGMLKESRRSQLSFQREGELVELLVDQGATVDKGQPLGHLDRRHIEAEQAQLKAQLTESSAMLAELTTGPRREVIAAKQAELRAQAARRDAIAKQVNRRESLVGTNAVSREEFESFSFDLAAAAADVERLQSQLDELQAGTRVEQIEAQRGRLAQIQAALVEIEHDLADTILRAPYAGRIAERLVDEGTIVSAGTPVLELLDDTHLEAWVGMPFAAAQQFSVGEYRNLEAHGQEAVARVLSLAAEVDHATRTRMVRFGVGSSEESGLLPGQVVRIAVQEKIAEPGFWLPSSALTRGSHGLWSVYVVKPTDAQGVIERRDVEMLDTVGEQSFVRGALSHGEQIVASGTHRVVAGQRVVAQPQLVAQIEQ